MEANVRESRLQKKRDDEAHRRATFKVNATPRDIEAQREYERNKKKKQLANETPQQREARLQRMRNYRARSSSTKGRRDKSTPAVSYTREYDRNQRRIQRERETPQQREERLQKAREYKATYKPPKSTRKERDAARERMAAIRLMNRLPKTGRQPGKGWLMSEAGGQSRSKLRRGISKESEGCGSGNQCRWWQ